MRGRLPTHFALISLAGCMTMTDPSAPGWVAAAQADPVLISAAESGDAAAVRKIIASDVEIDARDEHGRTALLAATHSNRIETARLLINAGADVNAKDDIEDSPYLYAGARGHLEILQMTLSHGADLASTNRYGGTALIPAAERGHRHFFLRDELGGIQNIKVEAVGKFFVKILNSQLPLGEIAFLDSVPKIAAVGVVMKNEAWRNHTIQMNDPNSIETEFNQSNVFRRPVWHTQITSRVRIRATAESFVLNCELDVFENDERVASRNWNPKILRRWV